MLLLDPSGYKNLKIFNSVYWVIFQIFNPANRVTLEFGSASEMQANIQLSPFWCLEESGREFFVVRDFRTLHH
jgi:hypothetical protein